MPVVPSALKIAPPRPMGAADRPGGNAFGDNVVAEG